LLWQHECLVNAQPPDRIVYDTGGTRAYGEDILRISREYVDIGPNTATVDTHIGWQIQSPLYGILRTSQAWDAFRASLKQPASVPRGLLFVDQRRVQGHPARLVAVELGQAPWLTIYTIQPASLLAGPRVIWSKNQDTNELRRLLDEGSMSTAGGRLYAGQADSVDSAHFTFEIVVNECAGTFDGWLMADDSVAIAIRDADYLDSAKRMRAPRPPTAVEPALESLHHERLSGAK
jgi:hypothetical protein